MNHQLNPEAVMLRNELEKQLKTLKNNRDNVPLAVLKTKYKTAYEALCRDIRLKASEYASIIALQGIRIHRDYLAEGLPIVNEGHRRIYNSFPTAQRTDSDCFGASFHGASGIIHYQRILGKPGYSAGNLLFGKSLYPARWQMGSLRRSVSV